MSDRLDRIKTIDLLMTEEVSPTFCLAKWHHTTIYMHRGQTHSCYHPKPHDIPLGDLKYDPSVLHNTPQKIDERIQMFNGEQPEGCKYCWNVENMGGDHISDRHQRNASIYKEERVDEILNNPPDFKVNPEYIEIAFSNECNFKCGYCHPMHSSLYMNEIKKHGPYTTVKNHRNDIDWFTVNGEEDNPYIDAWNKWWPEVSKTLNILRITGGEPLLHKTTWKTFDQLIENPRPQIEININTNMGYTPRRMEKLVDYVTKMRDAKSIKAFKMFSSMDTWGERAEYLRTGLDIETWEKNQDIYLRGVQSHITHMVTFNILSVTSFKSFLVKILEWRKTYEDVIPNNLGTDENVRKIRFDTPYLKEPIQYDMHILPKEEYLPYFDEILDFIRDNVVEDDRTMFSEIEYERFRRVRDYFETSQYDDAKIKEGRIDFYNWFTEYDKRRNVTFLDTFPEMEPFWNLCKRTHEEQD
jgi:organic radical activating enzyme|tara:strand:- start:12240 stop:13646 length:1407 start_codon:yes stop_codon:yes gene_type:complete